MNLGPAEKHKHPPACQTFCYNAHAARTAALTGRPTLRVLSMEALCSESSASKTHEPSPNMS